MTAMTPDEISERRAKARRTAILLGLVALSLLRGVHRHVGGAERRPCSDAADNRKLTLKLLGFALGSFAFGFALVPLYDVLCDLTGFGNQKALAEQRLTRRSSPDDTRTITVDFVADLPSVGNWEFRPTVASMQIHPGRLYKTEFFAHNLTGHDTVAQAVPNIAPGKAAGYFRKTECFCFTPQNFAVERAAAHGRALRGRSCDSALGRPHHAFVHFL